MRFADLVRLLGAETVQLLKPRPRAVTSIFHGLIRSGEMY